MIIAPSATCLGATVTEVRLNSLADNEWRAIIEDAFHERAVLVFPGANLSEDEHIAFSRRFGPLERTLSKRAERQEISLQPPRIFRHRWCNGDLVAWDNRCVLHRGHPWPFDQPRVMRRTTVAGDGDNLWTINAPGREAVRA